MKKGFFVVLEGNEGAGKTDQVKLLAQALALRTTQKYIVVREPGGTAIGEKIRKIIKEKDQEELTPHAELLLLFAARSQLIKNVIIPALENDYVVISDRFYYSTYVYQGLLRGLPLGLIDFLIDVVCNNIKPDLTFYLQCSNDVLQHRLSGRKIDDRFDDKYSLLNSYYEQLWVAFPNEITAIDGNKSRSAVHENIVRILNKKFVEKNFACTIRETPDSF